VGFFKIYTKYIYINIKKLLTILYQNVFGWKIKKAVADMDGKDEMMNPLV